MLKIIYIYIYIFFFLIKKHLVTLPNTSLKQSRNPNKKSLSIASDTPHKAEANQSRYINLASRCYPF